MKILVLGALGNLGRQLVDIFSKDSRFKVCGWDKQDIDISDKHLSSAKIKELSPDAVINAAAYNAVDRCEEDEDQYKLAKKLNTKAPANLAKVCQEINAVFVHYSSDYVFSGQNENGYTENAPTDPINKYGLTKAEGEKEIARLALSGLKWYLIRTSKLFGPKGKSEVAKPSFFDIMLRLAKDKEELEAVDEEKSCFTYTPDLALATKNMIVGQMDHGIYHVANSKPATWYEACQTLFDIAGVKKKLSPVSADKFPRPAKRPRYSELLNTKTTPLRSYEDALKEYLNR